MVALDATGYAGFLRALGHHVVRTDSGYWYNANRFFLLSAPPHRLYDPSERELRRIFLRLPCLGVRFAAPSHGRGTLSYQLVCDDPAYGWSSLSANVRSKVRRGLKRCEIAPAACSVLAAAGRRAHVDTLARQRRDDSLCGHAWERFWDVAGATPGFEGWGAWIHGELAAFLVSVTFDDGVEFLLARSSNDELGAYPNNALIFAVTEEMLVRRRAPKVTFGLESLEPVESLDQFKFSMGFRRQVLRQRIVFRPSVRALLRSGAVRALCRRWIERRGSEAVFWRKAAGLLRFAEEGGW